MPIHIVLPERPAMAGKEVCFHVTGAGGSPPALSLTDEDGAPIPDSSVTITATGEGTFRVCFTYPATQSVTIIAVGQKKSVDAAVL